MFEIIHLKKKNIYIYFEIRVVINRLQFTSYEYEHDLKMITEHFHLVQGLLPRPFTIV